jgi:anti-sigma-K factor RskA
MTDDFREIAALYALGCLDKQTAQEFSASLKTAPVSDQQEVAVFVEIAACLPFSLPPSPAPHYLKKHLMNRIAGESVVTNTDKSEAGKTSMHSSTMTGGAKVIPFKPAASRTVSASRWLAIAAAFALLLSTGILFFQNRQLSQQRDELTQQLQDSQREQQSTQRKLEEIISPLSKVASLSGDVAPQASARLIWDRQQQQWIIYIHDLPELPADKEYQLWYLTTDQRKISAAVFRPDARGRSELRVAIPPAISSRLTAAAVSIEPRGGSPQPTGAIYLKGVI